MIIIQAPSHYGNTKKISLKIGEITKSPVLDLKEVNEEKIKENKIIGFSSGVYLGKFHKGLLNLIDKLPVYENKKAVLISTSGVPVKLPFNGAHRKIKKKLKEKGFEVIEEFNCPGYDDYGPLKMIGGIRKGRPNEKDLQKAADFANKIKKYVD